MKWIGIITGVCLAIAVLLWFSGRDHALCLQMLANLDHQINCPSWVSMSEQEGTCSNGVWNPKAIMDITPQSFFRCPVTGTDYVYEFRVGTHTYCPVHGRLIEKYGVRPHQAWLHPPRVPYESRELGALVSLLVAIITGILGVVSVLIRRTRRKAQPTPAGDSGNQHA